MKYFYKDLSCILFNLFCFFFYKLEGSHSRERTLLLMWCWEFVKNIMNWRNIFAFPRLIDSHFHCNNKKKLKEISYLSNDICLLNPHFLCESQTICLSILIWNLEYNIKSNIIFKIGSISLSSSGNGCKKVLAKYLAWYTKIKITNVSAVISFKTVFENACVIFRRKGNSANPLKLRVVKN